MNKQKTKEVSNKRKWTKAEQFAHAKNRQEDKDLHLCINDITHEQYVLSIEAKEKWKSTANGVKDLRVSTGNHIEARPWAQEDRNHGGVNIKDKSSNKTGARVRFDESASRKLSTSQSPSALNVSAISPVPGRATPPRGSPRNLKATNLPKTRRLVSAPGVSLHSSNINGNKNRSNNNRAMQKRLSSPDCDTQRPQTSPTKNHFRFRHKLNVSDGINSSVSDSNSSNTGDSSIDEKVNRFNPIDALKINDYYLSKLNKQKTTKAVIVENWVEKSKFSGVIERLKAKKLMQKTSENTDSAMIDNSMKSQEQTQNNDIDNNNANDVRNPVLQNGDSHVITSEQNNLDTNKIPDNDPPAFLGYMKDKMDKNEKLMLQSRELKQAPKIFEIEISKQIAYKQGKLKRKVSRNSSMASQTGSWNTDMDDCSSSDESIDGYDSELRVVTKNQSEIDIGPPLVNHDSETHNTSETCEVKQPADDHNVNENVNNERNKIYVENSNGEPPENIEQTCIEKQEMLDSDKNNDEQGNDMDDSIDCNTDRISEPADYNDDKVSMLKDAENVINVNETSSLGNDREKETPQNNVELTMSNNDMDYKQTLIDGDNLSCENLETNNIGDTCSETKTNDINVQSACVETAEQNDTSTDYYSEKIKDIEKQCNFENQKEPSRNTDSSNKNIQNLDLSETEIDSNQTEQLRSIDTPRRKLKRNNNKDQIRTFSAKNSTQTTYYEIKSDNFMRFKRQAKEHNATVPLSRFVRHVEAGFDVSHVTKTLDTLHIPLSKASLKRQGENLLQRVCTNKLNGDIERRKMKVIESKIQAFLSELEMDMMKYEEEESERDEYRS